MTAQPAPLTVAEAQAQATAARARLRATLAILQARIAPKSLAQEAAQNIMTKTQDIAQDGIDTARKHPVPVGGAVAALGLFLLRKPLGRLFTRSRRDAAPSPATTPPTRATAKRKAT